MVILSLWNNLILIKNPFDSHLRRIGDPVVQYLRCVMILNALRSLLGLPYLLIWNLIVELNFRVINRCHWFIAFLMGAVLFQAFDVVHVVVCILTHIQSWTVLGCVIVKGLAKVACIQPWARNDMDIVGIISLHVWSVFVLRPTSAVATWSSIVKLILKARLPSMLRLCVWLTPWVVSWDLGGVVALIKLLLDQVTCSLFDKLVQLLLEYLLVFNHFNIFGLWFITQIFLVFNNFHRFGRLSPFLKFAFIASVFLRNLEHLHRLMDLWWINKMTIVV